MAHLFSFKTDLFEVAREDPNDINPFAGQSALLWLRDRLTTAQYRVSEPAAEDWGWYVDVEGHHGSYLVGASAEVNASPPIPWMLQVHKHRSLKDYFLRRNRMEAGDPLSMLIENLIRSHPRLELVEVARDA